MQLINRLIQLINRLVNYFTDSFNYLHPLIREEIFSKETESLKQQEFFISCQHLRAQFLNACGLVLNACCLMPGACLLLDAWTPPPLCGWVSQVFKHQAASTHQASSSKHQAPSIKHQAFKSWGLRFWQEIPKFHWITNMQICPFHVV